MRKDPAQNKKVQIKPQKISPSPCSSLMQTEGQHVIISLVWESVTLWFIPPKNNQSSRLECDKPHKDEGQCRMCAKTTCKCHEQSCGALLDTEEIEHDHFFFFLFLNTLTFITLYLISFLEQKLQDVACICCCCLQLWRLSGSKCWKCALHTYMTQLLESCSSLSSY